MGISTVVVQAGGWGQAVIVASLTVLGLVVTQTVVIRLFLRGERRRLDPFVVQCCPEYGSAVGQIKTQLHDKTSLAAISDYESSYERLSLIAPDEIHLVMESIQSDIMLAVRYQARGDENKFQENLERLFRDQMQFTQVVRRHLGQKEKIHRATPMIVADALESYEKSLLEN